MNRTTLTRIAMTTAGIMLAHQVASKAFRDAAFLSAWPATALPGLTLATAALVLALVPLFSRLLARFSPLAVVSAGTDYASWRRPLRAYFRRQQDGWKLSGLDREPEGAPPRGSSDTSSPRGTRGRVGRP